MKTGTFGPDDWTDLDSSGISTYMKSKTLAEKAAWDFVNQQADETPMELTVISPGGVFGPPLGQNIKGQSMLMLDQMLRGKLPMVPNAAFPMMDVRDVAKLHAEALTLPKGLQADVSLRHPQNQTGSKVPRSSSKTRATKFQAHALRRTFYCALRRFLVVKPEVCWLFLG